MQQKNNNKQVEITNDYTIFTTLPGNRKVDYKHVRKLEKAMSSNDLKIPIIVNEKLQVIDGQHRLQARFNLKLPVYYMVYDGMGIRETQQANAGNKNWKMDDYMNSYIEQNYHFYKTYKQFKNRWGFSHSECIHILNGKGRVSSLYDDFKNGDFSFSNIEEANDIAEKILSIEKYYDGVRRRSFVMAMISALENDSFDIDSFKNKLELHSSKLVHCTTAKLYLRLIEEIYNFGRQRENRIHFIY